VTHFTTSSEIKTDELIQFLETKDHKKIELKKIKPVVEDSFMELMSQKKGGKRD
jgi:hypothetical protein